MLQPYCFPFWVSRRLLGFGFSWQDGFYCGCKILHYLEDPKLWELRYIPSYG